MSKEIEAGIETLSKIAGRLRVSGAEFNHFDGVLYELIEAGLIEAEVGNFVRWIWAGETITECEFCDEWGIGMNINEDCGLMSCSKCEEEDNK